MWKQSLIVYPWKRGTLSEKHLELFTGLAIIADPVAITICVIVIAAATAALVTILFFLNWLLSKLAPY